MKVRSKPPLSYYGGKQNMIRHILPLIPKHEIYVEPFAGGAAVFFAKKSCKVEVLNDTNDRLITFYRALKTNFEELNTMIQGTLHSEADHRRAKEIYLNCEEYSSVEVAWAVWVRCNMSFAKQINGGFNYCISEGGYVPTRIKNKKKSFNYESRLENAQILSRDALQVIERFDTPETFYYIDPPYPGADQGHYKGYTMGDFLNLLDALENLKGKFILSNYWYKELQDFRDRNKWNYTDFEMTQSTELDFGEGSKEGKTKIETLTYNYNPEEQTLNLFS